MSGGEDSEVAAEILVRSQRLVTNLSVRGLLPHWSGHGHQFYTFMWRWQEPEAWRSGCQLTDALPTSCHRSGRLSGREVSLQRRAPGSAPVRERAMAGVGRSRGQL